MKWININDRLPDNSDPVLLWDLKYGEVEVGKYMRLFPYDHYPKSWYIEIDNDFAQLTNVTHWMPFPDPPPRV